MFLGLRKASKNIQHPRNLLILLNSLARRGSHYGLQAAWMLEVDFVEMKSTVKSTDKSKSTLDQIPG